MLFFCLSLLTFRTKLACKKRGTESSSSFVVSVAVAVAVAVVVGSERLWPGGCCCCCCCCCLVFCSVHCLRSLSLAWKHCESHLTSSLVRSMGKTLLLKELDTLVVPQGTVKSRYKKSQYKKNSRYKKFFAADQNFAT